MSGLGVKSRLLSDGSLLQSDSSIRWQDLLGMKRAYVGKIKVLWIQRAQRYSGFGASWSTEIHHTTISVADTLCVCSRWNYLSLFQVKSLSFAVFKALLCQQCSVSLSILTEASHSQSQAAVRCFRCQHLSLEKDSSGIRRAVWENILGTNHQCKRCA